MADDNDEKMRGNLARWYAALSSRNVDIVGDYGGKELFLIHGDSLVLHCIGSSRVDFEDGFQLLHAVFAVEAFLSKLKSQGCNFRVAFFDDHQELCIPAPVSENNRYKYRLARMILIRHLQQFMNRGESGDHLVFCFPSCGCLAFGSWLERNAILFILCHDGHKPDQIPSDQQVLFQYMIHRFLRHEYSVALIHSVNFQSSRVFATMITSTPKFHSMSPFSLKPAGETKDDGPSGIANIEAVSISGSSFRERLTVAILSKILRTNPSDDSIVGAIAVIIHAVIIRLASLPERSLDVQSSSMSGVANKSANRFMKLFCQEAGSVLHTRTVDSRVYGTDWDLFDFFDGRLFLSMYSLVLEGRRLPQTVVDEAKSLAAYVEQQSGTMLIHHRQFPSLGTSSTHTPPHASTEQASVLPFNLEALGEFLEPIKLDVVEDSASSNESKVFQELSHWHSSKLLVNQKRTPKAPGFFRMKRTQKFMADNLAYSASLTGATGKLLKPEVIIKTPRISTLEVPSQSGASSPARPSRGRAKRAAGKNVPSTLGGKKKALDEAQAFQTRKVESKNNVAMVNWTARSKELENEADLVKRFKKATKLLNDHTGDEDVGIKAEISVYICDILYRAWASSSEPARDDRALEVAALLFKHAVETSNMPGLTPEAFKALQAVGTSLKMPSLVTSSRHFISRSLCIPLRIGQDVMAAQISGEPANFQLKYCGPYLERSFDSRKDSRVPFDPDAWQRTVLDGIDNDKSLFIVAPTSSGKTFISFYAMKKVLQADDDGVLVYVAPTKALVNQIAAEIQARFQKSYDHQGRSVWAIHTRDYRVNNPNGCQVLVTVPHVLQIMLLGPSNATGTNAWSRRVKRIIFDEVHCIGQADDGLIWEQLLLMAPCPIIALSATVGNPQDFYEWLRASQKSKGFELEMIQHHSRYSDLRAFFHLPASSFDFKGLVPFNSLPVPGLDRAGSANSFRFIHPIAATINRVGVDLDEISLEPRDTFTLWNCMKKNQSEAFPVDSSLDPPSTEPSRTLDKSDVLEWTRKLKATLKSWMRDTESPFQKVRADLGRLTFYGRGESQTEVNEASKAEGDDDVSKVATQVKKEDASVLALLVDLRREDGLPAILFNYDRSECEHAVRSVLGQLQSAEEGWKQSSKEWSQLMKKYESWKEAEKRRGRAKDPRKLTREERAMEDASVERSLWESFDPNGPHQRFSFADNSKFSKLELEETINSLDEEHIPRDLFDALKRGLGVHHAGMNRRYRQVVEMLFRKGFLTVVIATGTLALGINMPCKTVVFFGDSAYLTPLAYRQASGRAGRRGFDLLGNVVFSNTIRPRRAFELMSSRLPDLKGHFPLSTTLILRVLGLIHATATSSVGSDNGNASWAVDLFKSLLSHNRLYLGGPEAKMAIRHHLRFSIEYLRRQHLLSADGKPLNFAGLIGHLYFKENAAFAFHSLLKGGYLHRLCSQIHKNRTETLRTLALVMAHLFNRHPATGLDAASSLVLPRLPEDAERLLTNHNTETLQIFKTYAASYIENTCHDIDRHLPLTGIAVGAERPGVAARIDAPGALPPPVLRSPFAGLSGHTDSFASVHDLCSGIRSGVFLEESAVPHLRIWPHEEGTVPLNAYLYNFFVTGDYAAMIRDHRIRKGDVWFILKDFSLVLATIVTSLTNFVRPDGSNSGGLDDVNMIDVDDSGETPEEGWHDREQAWAKTETSMPPDGAFPGDSLSSARTAPVSPKKSRKSEKKVVLDSWEDDITSSSDAEYERDRPESKTSTYDTAGSTNRSSFSYPPSSPGLDTMSSPAWEGTGEGASLGNVLRAFMLFKDEFDEKFFKIWA